MKVNVKTKLIVKEKIEEKVKARPGEGDDEVEKECQGCIINTLFPNTLLRYTSIISLYYGILV